MKFLCLHHSSKSAFRGIYTQTLNIRCQSVRVDEPKNEHFHHLAGVFCLFLNVQQFESQKFATFF